MREKERETETKGERTSETGRERRGEGEGMRKGRERGKIDRDAETEAVSTEVPQYRFCPSLLVRAGTSP